MTITVTTVRETSAGNGVTTVFPTTFKFFDEDDLRVSIIVDATGVETVQTITTHYNVSGGNGAVGNVTMVTAPASGETLVVKRITPKTQSTDFQANDPFPAEVQERALDRLTMLVQEACALAERALVVPETTALGSNPTLPDPVSGQFLVGNSGGTGFDNTTLASLGTLSITPTPVDNQLAIWTGATGLEGDSNLTWDGSTLTITGALTCGAFTSNSIVDNGTEQNILSADNKLTLGTASDSFDLVRSTDDGRFRISGDVTVGAGIDLQIFGGSHSSSPGRFIIRQDATSRYEITASSGDADHRFLDASGVLALFIDGVTGRVITNGIDDQATSERIEIFDSGIDIGPNTNTDYNIRRAAADGVFTLSGGTTGSLGGNIRLFGQSNASNPSDIFFREDGTSVGQWNATSSQWDWKSTDFVSVGNFESAGIDDNATSREIRITNNNKVEFGGGGNPILITEANTAVIGIVGGNSSGNGGNTFWYGASHSTNAGDILMRSSTTVVATWDQSNLWWDFNGQEIVDVSSLAIGSDTGPTITSGTGVPTASEPNGSLFLRTDGGAGSTLYVRESGAWNAV